MKTLFDRQEKCSLCHQEKTCAGALAYQNAATANKPRLYQDPCDPNMKKNLENSGPHADLFACEDCAEKQGKKPTMLFIFWAVSLVLAIGLMATTFGNKSGASVGAAMRPIVILELSFIVCGIMLVLKAGIPSVGLRCLCILLAFTPFGAIPILLLRKRINQREQIRTALVPHMAEAIEAVKAKDPENQKLTQAVKNELVKQIVWAPEPIPAPAAEKAEPKAQEAAKPGPGNTFYVFVLQGRGFGQPDSDMPRELAEQLQGDYPASSGMRLEIVGDSRWNGKVETSESAGMFSSSAGIGDQIPGIRSYLKRLDLSDEAVDAGIAELESLRLQRINPFGGVFVFGVPIR